MPNSIRTPKPGTPKHIAEAVDNEEWQKFRVSLKGTSTRYKLVELRAYLNTGGTLATNVDEVAEYALRRVRVDNYLKALARGGQIEPSTAYIADLNANCLVIRR